jgi:hypothetical protein
VVTGNVLNDWASVITKIVKRLNAKKILFIII